MTMLKKCLLMMTTLLALGSTAWAVDFTYADDTQALATLNTLADRLILVSRTRATLHIGIVDYNEVNAFATASGQVFFTRKLLQSVSTEEELAAVLAHELGHLSKKFPAQVTRSFAAVDGDEMQADQQGMKLLTRVSIDSSSLLTVLVKVSKAWGNDMPSAQRRQMSRRLRSVAKKAHVDLRQAIAFS
jgi:hypothetical protein